MLMKTILCGIFVNINIVHLEGYESILLNDSVNFKKEVLFLQEDIQ